MTPEKPCRTCMEFKTWAKQQSRNWKSEKIQENTQAEEKPYLQTAGPNRENCPLDKDELGSKTWGFLHTMAAYFPEKPTSEEKKDMANFVHLFSKFYPCNTCAEDLREQLKTSPPKTESQHDFSTWLCNVHNAINQKLGKPTFDCKFVLERWKDGWADGSCD